MGWSLCSAAKFDNSSLIIFANENCKHPLKIETQKKNISERPSRNTILQIKIAFYTYNCENMD